jgi:hypothetical protein
MRHRDVAQLFADLSEICGPGTVLATNTSSILGTSLAGAAAEPDNVVGMHFFNPPPLMGLLEVIAAEQTGERALAIARATGNSALTGVVEYLWNQRGSLWHKLKEHFQTEELRQQTLIDHRNIFAAIASHDVAGARTAMRAHLDRVTRTFSRG